MTAAIEIYKQHRAALVKKLDQYSSMMHAMLPPEMPLPRFRAVTMLAVQKDPQLLECHMPSVVLSILRAAECGLELGREAHLVRFYNRRKGRHECQFIADYKGLIHLALLSDRVSKIEAELVYPDDTFELEKGSTPRLVHKPSLRGHDLTDMTHAYAIAFYTDGQTQFEVMDRQALDAIRKKSNARDREGNEVGPWKEWPDRMYRKTPIRSLYRFLPLVNRARSAYATDQARGWPRLDGDSGRGDTLKSKLAELDEDDVIDAEIEDSGTGNAKE